MRRISEPQRARMRQPQRERRAVRREQRIVIFRVRPPVRPHRLVVERDGDRLVLRVRLDLHGRVREYERLHLARDAADDQRGTDAALPRRHHVLRVQLEGGAVTLRGQPERAVLGAPLLRRRRDRHGRGRSRSSRGVRRRRGHGGRRCPTSEQHHHRDGTDPERDDRDQQQLAMAERRARWRRRCRW